MKSIKDMSHDEFMVHIRKRIKQGLEDGVHQGWWKDFDEKTLTPIPNDIIFKLEDFHEKATLAHVMHRAGLFKSVSEARRNGWDKPIILGTWTFKKRRLVVKIEK